MAASRPNCVALVAQSAAVSSFQAAILSVLSVDALEKITYQNDRREDTNNVAGRPPDSRFAKAASNRKVIGFGQRSV